MISGAKISVKIIKKERKWTDLEAERCRTRQEPRTTGFPTLFDLRRNVRICIRRECLFFLHFFLVSRIEKKPGYSGVSFIWSKVQNWNAREPKERMVTYIGWNLTFYEANLISVRFGRTHNYYSGNAENAKKSFCTAALLSVNTDLIAFLSFRGSFEAPKYSRFSNFIKWPR